MSDPRLVDRLATALGPGLERSRTPGADWVVHARPGPTAAPSSDPSTALPPGVRLHRQGPLLGVVVPDDLLVAALGDRPGPGEDAPTADDVPQAWARATGRDRARFAGRRLDNPAYAAVLVHDRARRGLPVPGTRRLLVAVADLPRTAAPGVRPHRLAEGLGEVAAAALAEGVPVAGCPDAGPDVAATMALALRRLGVPDIERL